jgi:hypothetical protein
MIGAEIQALPEIVADDDPVAASVMAAFPR